MSSSGQASCGGLDGRFDGVVLVVSQRHPLAAKAVPTRA
jgi:hypothetical protein